MKNTLSITLAQLNPVVGDIQGNLNMALEAIADAKDNKADVILFPECFLSGYPADDLLYRPAFLDQCSKAITELTEKVEDIHVIFTYPKKEDDNLYNMAGVFFQRKCIAEYKKQKLPNTDLFDEERYYKAGSEPLVIDIQGYKVGILICEDLWHDEPIASTIDAGAKIILAPNASPFSINQDKERKKLLRTHIKDHKIPIVYCNNIGGQDDCVFDGGSFLMDINGDPKLQAPFFEEICWKIEIDQNYEPLNAAFCLAPPKMEVLVYDALVLGVRDYVRKNNFEKVILGLSGGIDSAVTLAVCCDALGPDNVEAVLMPSQYTSDLSNEGALEQIKKLGVTHQIIEIEPIFDSFMKQLKPAFKGTEPGLAEQNLQARVRGTLLMSLSNKFNKLVMTTGNRSELATGYSTLYGDMAGAFCVLKDVPKTLVYELAEYYNKKSKDDVIPRAVIERPPSAELAPDQLDQDSLPAYETLDIILDLYINQEQSFSQILAKGYKKEVLENVIRRVEINEYKRKQSPPGVRINKKAFGRDRRYPITSSFRSD